MRKFDNFLENIFFIYFYDRFFNILNNQLISMKEFKNFVNGSNRIEKLVNNSIKDSYSNDLLSFMDKLLYDLESSNKINKEYFLFYSIIKTNCGNYKNVLNTKCLRDVKIEDFDDLYFFINTDRNSIAHNSIIQNIQLEYKLLED